MKLKCQYCGKPIKEDTKGDEKYCQGHSIFDRFIEKQEIHQDERTEGFCLKQKGQGVK